MRRLNYTKWILGEIIENFKNSITSDFVQTFYKSILTRIILIIKSRDTTKNFL